MSNETFLILSNADTQGGAARAAHRLHEGLKGLRVNSQMLVQSKYSSDHAIVPLAKTRVGESIAWSRIAVDNLPLKLYRARQKTPFSLQWLPDQTTAKISQINPSLINLHWINAAFLSIETIAQLNRPLVWTLHDMWAFTGGCHYNQDCDRYQKSCGACPQLSSRHDWDLSRWVWHRKWKAWRELNLTVVTPSQWLAKCAASSALFADVRVEVIANGIDTELYKPVDKQLARQILNLPQDKHLVLVGALSVTSDRRKGFHLLQPALAHLEQSAWHDNLELVIFGASESQQQPTSRFKSHYLGTLSDDISLVLAYSAADVFVLPSVQENLPNTIMEALACGVPCVAFNIGGVADMIEHQKNGFLVQPYSSEHLAQGIRWSIENLDRSRQLSSDARNSAEQKFTLQNQAHQYLQLFREICMDSKV